MANTKRKWPVIAGVAFIVAFIVAMLATTSGNAKFSCEVCMPFNGRTACRSGGAATKQEAQRLATDLACSDLGAGGFSHCSDQQPVSVKWK